MGDTERLVFPDRESLSAYLRAGHVIPAHPLALDHQRRLDERHQRALTRYYLAAGAGGVAVGVHTTQFRIRECGLYHPVLELVSETVDAAAGSASHPAVKVAGICGRTEQAVAEAECARSLGYHCGLLSLGAWREPDDDSHSILDHCRIIAETIPVFGFYLQPLVGGRVFPFSFWRRFAEIPGVVAVKIAPFNRYQTLDVVRAFVEAGRDDVALYTGNDDSIVTDLLTPFCFSRSGGRRWIAGGLLGHWAVWTRRAVELLAAIKATTSIESGSIAPSWLTRAAAVTDSNGALFDAAHGFAGCIPGIHEVLRRQRLLAGNWCLDPGETLSPGQEEDLDRVISSYPELVDDDFVAEHLDEWLR